jgi:hypothetical protein
VVYISCESPLGHIYTILTCGYSSLYTLKWTKPQLTATGVQIPLGHTPTYTSPVPPLDPAADIALDLGRDIPSRVRHWALTAELPPGADRVAPAWVLDEPLSFPE